MEIMMIRLALSTFNPREIPYLLVTFVATSVFDNVHIIRIRLDDYWECQFLKATKKCYDIREKGSNSTCA